MTVFQIQTYGGASYWASVPVIRFVLEAGEERLTNLIPGLCEKLSAALPGMLEHSCSGGGDASHGSSFFERVREGVNLGHVIKHMALELQRQAGQTVNDCQEHATTDAAQAGSPVARSAIFTYQECKVGIAAGKLAIRLLESLLGKRIDADFDFERGFQELRCLALERSYGLNTRAMVAEAERRDIPVRRLNKPWERIGPRSASSPRPSLLQLGHGKFQKRIWAPYFSTDSYIAAQIASNKELTNRLLSDAGLPVPRMISVTDEDAAALAAREIGYPVVLKPLNGNHGRGVGVRLRDEAAVRAHYPLALRETASGTILVESFVAGHDHRFLVVGRRFVAAAERVPAHVTGDGSHTLRQLIDLTNAEPRRGVGKAMTRIIFDDAAMTLAREQGYSPGDVPALGNRVQLVLTANISTGGISIDRSDEVHSFNVAIAEQAALVIGLDVAGIDLISPDISQSVLDTGGAICEVNGGPGLDVHTQPGEGRPRNVVRPVIDLLFPPGTPSRVPIVAVTGNHGTAITSRMIAHILKIAGRHVGLATSDGLYIDGTLMVQSDSSGPAAAHMVLRNPVIDAAVLETGHEGILRSGLGFDRADVAVITDVVAKQTSLPGIDTLRDLAQLNAVVARSTGQCGVTVLNADDEWCVRIAGETQGGVIYFSMQADNPVIESHRRAGGRGLVSRKASEGEVLCAIDGGETCLLLAQEIPALREGCTRVTVASALAAAAACLALDIDLECVRHGLRTFEQR